MSRLGRLLLELCGNDFHLDMRTHGSEFWLLRFKPLDIQMHAMQLGIMIKW